MRNIFRDHDGSVRSVDFSPNGRLVASASLDETVRIWNLRDGSARVFSDNAHGLWSVRFSPNGQYVVAGNSDWILRIWDVRSGQLVKRWRGHGGTIWSVAFTPDGKGLLSGSGDGVAKYWDIGSLGVVQSGGEPVATKILEYKGHSVCLVFCVFDFIYKRPVLLH
jgi:glucose repression regulatory protein TUP1